MQCNMMTIDRILPQNRDDLNMIFSKNKCLDNQVNLSGFTK